MAVVNIALEKAALESKPVLARLMQLYLHDFTEFDQADIGEDGLYEYKYFDEYWQEEGRYPFFIRADGKLAGFVLVYRMREIWTIAEFFVMRKYRRQGVGRSAAKMVFDLFPGKWNVQEEAYNVPAQIFWRKVIADYADCRYLERTWEFEGKEGPVQEFVV